MILWILLCVAAACSIGWVFHSWKVSMLALPVLFAPYAYVSCHAGISICCLAIFTPLSVGVIVQKVCLKPESRKIRRDAMEKGTVDLSECGREHTSRKSRLPGLVAVGFFLVWAAFLGANAVISTLLVPDFMEQLEVFERVTTESYSQLVQTDELTENHRSAAAIAKLWAEETEMEVSSIISTDGYHLNSAVFPAGQDNHQWVILLHGYTGWKEAMYPIACWYWKQGFSCLVPDLRCQGTSEGDYIGLGLTDSQDVLLWIDWILQTDPQAQIVLHGQSMGAATVLMMSGLPELPDAVLGGISDCAYSDAFAMFQTTAAGWLGISSLPDWCLEFICFTFRLRGGYDLHEASPITNVKHARIPILIIHGDKDRMIPVEMSQELYDATTSEKELWIVEGAGHAQSQDKDPEGYFGHVKVFLKSVNIDTNNY